MRAVTSPQILPAVSEAKLLIVDRSFSLARCPGVAPDDAVGADDAPLLAVSTVFFIVNVADDPEPSTSVRLIVPGSDDRLPPVVNLPFMSDVFGLRLASIDAASLVYHQSRSDVPL